MRSIWLAAAALVLALSRASAAESDIKLPTDADEYSTLVARAMAQDPATDFHALRVAYLKSAAFHRAGAAFNKLRQLREEMVAATQSTDTASTVRDRAEQILSIDFTNLEAHKLLRQSCAMLRDDACAGLHHFIEFGLLRSITANGDGKTCATGWEAVQIPEEYFVLNMLGVTLQRQALVSDRGHACDSMSGTDEHGAPVTYFFNIDLMMAAEASEIEGHGAK